jgi:protein-tyrosine phosphatase
VDADWIAKGLYIGSVPRSCGSFDAVVLAAKEYQKLGLLCPVILAPLDDSVPSREEIKIALAAAHKVNSLRRNGKRVLVTCAQGRNRSALVAALALMMEGATAKQAVQRILERRVHAPFGMKPLSNKAFIEVLKDYERVQRVGRG